MCATAFAAAVSRRARRADRRRGPIQSNRTLVCQGRGAFNDIIARLWAQSWGSVEPAFVIDNGPEPEARSARTRCESAYDGYTLLLPTRAERQQALLLKALYKSRGLHQIGFIGTRAADSG